MTDTPHDPAAGDEPGASTPASPTPPPAYQYPPAAPPSDGPPTVPGTPTPAPPGGWMPPTGGTYPPPAPPGGQYPPPPYPPPAPPGASYPPPGPPGPPYPPQGPPGPPGSPYPAGGYPPPGNYPPGYPYPPGGQYPATWQPTPTVEIGDALKYGWEKYQEHIGAVAKAIAVWIGVYVVAFGLYFVSIGVISSTSSGAGVFFSLLLMAAIWFFISSAQYLASYPMVRMALAISAGREPTNSEMFGGKRFGTFVLTSFAVALATLLGTLLCYLPGIAAMFLFYLAPYYSADRGLGPEDAMRASFEVTKRYVWPLLAFAVVVYLVQMAGFMACLVGILVAGPVTVIATAHVFRQINHEPIAP